MAKTGAKRTEATADKSLFDNGWLDEQLSQVVRDLASRPQEPSHASPAPAQRACPTRPGCA